MIPFVGATFNYTEPRERNLVRDRGQTKEVTVGDDQPIDWTFTVQYEDRGIFRTIRDGVWANQAETVTGLTPAALNLNVDLDYDYEQNSLLIAVGDPIYPGTKLGIGVAPTTGGEFSENLGTSDVELVIAVPKAGAAPGGFNIWMPAADTDVDLTYDGVGESQDPSGVLAAGACVGSIKYFRLRLDLYDPCDPPSTLDLSLGTVVERHTIEFCWLTEDGFAENEEADEASFTGQSLARKVLVVPVP